MFEFIETFGAVVLEKLSAVAPEAVVDGLWSILSSVASALIGILAVMLGVWMSNRHAHNHFKQQHELQKLSSWREAKRERLEELYSLVRVWQKTAAQQLVMAEGFAFRMAARGEDASETGVATQLYSYFHVALAQPRVSLDSVRPSEASERGAAFVDEAGDTSCPFRIYKGFLLTRPEGETGPEEFGKNGSPSDGTADRMRTLVTLYGSASVPAYKSAIDCIHEFRTLLHEIIQYHRTNAGYWQDSQHFRVTVWSAFEHLESTIVDDLRER